MRTVRKSEHEEQAVLVAQVIYEFKHRQDFHEKLFFAVPNAVYSGPALNRLLAEGMRSGVADIVYLQPRGPYSCLLIEMKAPDQWKKKDQGITPDQREFLETAGRNGASVHVCYDADAALEVFRHYMTLDTNIRISTDVLLHAPQEAE
jgi:hypothetical protein